MPPDARRGAAPQATCLAPDHRLHHACGSPAYCSPEIFKASTSGGGYKHATDLWSCGVVLYVMLSGYTPFGDDRALITAGAFAFHEEHRTACRFDNDSSTSVER